MNSTSLVTFFVDAPGASLSVQLLGSWDNFSRPYPLTRDRYAGVHRWRGCHSFTNIICDGAPGRNVDPAAKRDGGLRMGATYWYYYRLDDDVEYADPIKPSTTQCPYLPGQTVNILDMPFQLPSPDELPTLDRRRTSFGFPDVFTLNPDDKFRKLPHQLPAADRSAADQNEKNDKPQVKQETPRVADAKVGHLDEALLAQNLAITAPSTANRSSPTRSRSPPASRQASAWSFSQPLRIRPNPPSLRKKTRPRSEILTRPVSDLVDEPAPPIPPSPRRPPPPIPHSPRLLPPDRPPPPPPPAPSADDQLNSTNPHAPVVDTVARAAPRVYIPARTPAKLAPRPTAYETSEEEVKHTAVAGAKDKDDNSEAGLDANFDELLHRFPMSPTFAPHAFSADPGPNAPVTPTSPQSSLHRRSSRTKRRPRPLTLDPNNSESVRWKRELEVEGAGGASTSTRTSGVFSLTSVASSTDPASAPLHRSRRDSQPLTPSFSEFQQFVFGTAAAAASAASAAGHADPSCSDVDAQPTPMLAKEQQTFSGYTLPDTEQASMLTLRSLRGSPSLNSLNSLHSRDANVFSSKLSGVPLVHPTAPSPLGKTAEWPSSDHADDGNVRTAFDDLVQDMGYLSVAIS